MRGQSPTTTVGDRQVGGDGVWRGSLGSMGEISVRQVSVRRARLERWLRPIGCWFRNRWKWRKTRVTGPANGGRHDELR